MHSVFLKPLRFTAMAIAGILALAACSSSPAAPQIDTQEEISHIATVNVASDSSQAQLEQMYGGSTLAFRPEAGFAILGFTQSEGELTTLSTELNADIAAPDVHANGSSSWASGTSSWASGNSSWASGNSSWASGASSWASGSTLAPESIASLSDVRIEQAHAMVSNFGLGVKVAVIDSGLDLDHPGLAGRLAPASEWKDFIDNDSTPEDENPWGAPGQMYGHGTAVAGIIAQIAPQATILPIRVLDSWGGGKTSDAIAAIDHAISQGADVINLSLGTNGGSNSFKAMIDYATSQNVHLIVAAGNAGNNGIDHPAKYAKSASNSDYIMSVGSVNASKQRSSFSNHDADLEFMAPGEGIFSIFPDGQIGFFSGTSFSTPIISGMVALGLAEGGSQNMHAYLASSAESMTGSDNGYGIPLADLMMEELDD